MRMYCMNYRITTNFIKSNKFSVISLIYECETQYILVIQIFIKIQKKYIIRVLIASIKMCNITFAPKTVT